jgi:site-specific DNA-methyltransferase (adenine-specific)
VRPYYEEAGITILLGDCREILLTLSAVDHVITDPPYGRDVYVRMRKADSASSQTHKVKHGSDLRKLAAGEIGAVDDLIAPVSQELVRLTRRWGLVFSDVESCHLWRAALIAAGSRYVRTGAWIKPDAMPQMTGDRPGVGFEPCTIVHSNQPMKWNGGGHLATWTHGVSRNGHRPDHPCPKPLELIKELIGLFTDRAETILDPFVGSGTTLRAAKDLGRKAIGIEIEEKYCEIAANRLSQGVFDFGQSK